MKYKKEKLTSAIQELAGKYIATKSFANTMITITDVLMSECFSKAKICFTVYPTDKEKLIETKLNRGKGRFAQYVKSNGRITSIPHFSFAIDKGEKHRQRIEELSKQK